MMREWRQKDWGMNLTCAGAMKHLATLAAKVLPARISAAQDMPALPSGVVIDVDVRA